jgi:hypothetical protein
MDAGDGEAVDCAQAKAVLISSGRKTHKFFTGFDSTAGGPPTAI